MSDLTKILAENQKEMLKLIAPVVKTPATQNLENSDSEPKNVLPNTTSTSIKTKATTSKITAVNSRNKNQLTFDTTVCFKYVSSKQPVKDSIRGPF